MQTSNVLYEFEGNVDDVVIPLRLISTDDEDVIQSIVTATNQQTQLSREQLFAATEFPKKLELFFQAYPEPNRLWYERRSRQYDRVPIKERLRIITQANLIRAFAGMFLEEPHRTTRNFNALLDKIGKEIFVERHRLEPYYVAAFSLYKLEKLFKTRIDPKFKVARFQILLAFRRLANKDPLPQIGSREMESFCTKITDILCDNTAADDLIEQASETVAEIIADNFDRDYIRTVAITDKIKKYPMGVAPPAER